MPVGVDPAPAHAPARVELARSDRFRWVAHRCAAGPGDRPYLELHAAPSISLVRRGVFTYRPEGRSHTMTPGALLLGNAGEEFACSHEHGRGDECVSLELPQDLLEEMAEANGRRAGPRFERSVLPPHPRVEALFALALRAAGEPCSALRLAQLACAATAAVVRALRGEARARRGQAIHAAAREHAVAAVAYIDAHAFEPIALAEIAAAAGLSPFHFLRTFRREIGVTPHQYLIRTRLRRAVGLLLDTSAPVTEVAFDVGFGDLSNFVRTFHREVGCSPRELRRGRLADSKILQDPSPRGA